MASAIARALTPTTVPLIGPCHHGARAIPDRGASDITSGAASATAASPASVKNPGSRPREHGLHATRTGTTTGVA